MLNICFTYLISPFKVLKQFIFILCVQVLRAHILPLTNCCFNKSGDKFITGSYDRTCKVICHAFNHAFALLILFSFIFLSSSWFLGCVICAFYYFEDAYCSLILLIVILDCRYGLCPVFLAGFDTIPFNVLLLVLLAYLCLFLFANVVGGKGIY